MNSRVPRFILALDLAWLVAASVLSYTLCRSHLGPSSASSFGVLVLTSAGVWILLSSILALDCFRGGWRFHAVLSKIVRAAMLLMIFVIAFAYLTEQYYSRLLLIWFGALLFAGFFLIRVSVYLFLRRQHTKGHARKVVLVGNERLTREFAFKIVRHPELLYQVAGMLYPVGGAMISDTATPGGQPLSSLGVLEAFAQRRVDELIVLDEPVGAEWQNFLARCRTSGIRVNLLPRGYELYTSKAKLIEIDGLPLILFEGPSRLPGEAAIKRVMDLLIGVLLLPTALLIFAASAVVLLSHKRAVLRRELRVGKNGRPFWMYRLNVDRDDENASASEKFMGNLSISEIPQLWNVLMGEMSLVGPRAESPNRVKHYSQWQKERLRVKPGMTGLAQVNGLREQHASEEKTRFDLQYLLEWSPFTDLVLLLQTIGTLARRCLPARGSSKAAQAAIPHERKRTTPVRSKPLSEVVHADRA